MDMDPVKRRRTIPPFLGLGDASPPINRKDRTVDVSTKHKSCREDQAIDGI